MSGGWVPPGGEPFRWVPPVGWYPDPQGRGELRWWDGTAWSASWPAAVPAAARSGPAWSAPPARLASLAAAGLLAVAAAVTMVGWIGGAAVLAGTAAAAHPLLPGPAVDVSAGLVLPVADIALWISAHTRRTEGAVPAPPPGVERAMRRAARRARWATFGPWVPVQAVRRFVRTQLHAFASLPRPVAWVFAAAVWSTIGTSPWVLFEAVSHGFSDVATTASGQQAVVLVWMAHLIAWSGMACRRLDRARAAARVGTMVSVGTPGPNQHPERGLRSY